MLAQKLVLGYSSKLVVQFVQIGVGIVVARIAGPTVLGTVAYGLAFVSLFSFIADLGTGPAHMKLISEGRDLGSCLSTFGVIKISLTAIFFFVVLSIFLAQKYIFRIEFESVAQQYVIIIFLMAITLQQLLGIFKVTFAARTEQAKYNIPDIARVLILQVLRIIVVLLGYGAVALSSAHLASTILIIPLVLFLFKGYHFSNFDKTLARQYFKISLPVMLMGMSTMAVTYLDRVLLQYYTNAATVGIYSAGYRIGSLVLMIANSIGLLFFPLFSKAVSSGDFLYIKRTIEKVERFIFLFIMPAVIFLSLYADVIVGLLLGGKYTASIPVMTVMNLAMFLMVINAPYGNVLTAMGFFKLAALLNMINLCAFILFMYVFLNPNVLNLGAVGAAIAVFLSNMFIGASYRFFAKRKCPILNLGRNAKFLLFGIGSFVTLYFLYNKLSVIYGANFKLLFILLYFVIIYLVLSVLGWITRRDVRDLKEVVNFKKMNYYIRSEIKRK